MPAAAPANAASGGFKSAVLQLLWLWAVLGVIGEFIVVGATMNAYFNEFVEAGTSWYQVIDIVYPPDWSGSLGDLRNERFFVGTSLISLFYLALHVFFAELGCVCVTDNAKMLGTLRGRGWTYMLMGFMTLGLSSSMGLAVGGLNFACGFVHWLGGCCCCRGVRKDKEKYRQTMNTLHADEGWGDVQEANPGWTKAAARITRNFADKIGAWGGQEPAGGQQWDAETQAAYAQEGYEPDQYYAGDDGYVAY